MRSAVRIRLVPLLLLSIGPALAAAQSETGSATNPPAPGEARLSADELEKLVAPIALYPDVLLAQILPAATFPTDVVMAARWLQTKPDLAELDAKPWDESVKALCHYPDVLSKLLAQQEDLMQAVQACRQRAQTRDLLQTTPEQTIVTEEDTIRIVPTEADTVYVPQYDPQIVYIDDDDHDYSAAWTGTGAAIGFGAGLALGTWLNMDCYWHGGIVHYTTPGYYGGWAHSGVVAWGPNRVAAVGPERGFVAGPRGGADRATSPTMLTSTATR
jgi:hypothetical protein